MKRFLFFFVVFFVCTIANAQATLSGTVYDNAGDPIVGATVGVSMVNNKGESTGKYKAVTITDVNGNFMLYAPAGIYELTVSYVGFKEFVSYINLSNSLNLKISLAEDNNGLDEIAPLHVNGPLCFNKTELLVFPFLTA